MLVKEEVVRGLDYLISQGIKPEIKGILLCVNGAIVSNKEKELLAHLISFSETTLKDLKETIREQNNQSQDSPCP